MQVAMTYFNNAGAPSAFKAELAAIQKAHDSSKKDNDFIVSHRIAGFAIPMNVHSFDEVFSIMSECLTWKHCQHWRRPLWQRHFLSLIRLVPDLKVEAFWFWTFLLVLVFPFPSKQLRDTSDLFGDLVPVQVSNALAVYESRRQEIVNMETCRLREHSQLMNGILASLNLPAAIEDVEAQDAIPESVTSLLISKY